MTAFAFVFPGQGSQSVGMLDAWGDHPAVASDAAGGLRRARRGRRPPDPRRPEGTARPHHQHPAGDADRGHRLPIAPGCAEGGAAPAAVAGHSLGEYTALVAAGVLTLADALPLVRLRATAMQEAVPVGVGAMAAILGLDAAGRARRLPGRRRGQRRGRRGRQLQRPEADRDRRHQGRRRQGLRDAQGRGRQARAAAAGVGAVPLQPDEAGRRAPARAALDDGHARTRRPFRSSTTSTWPRRPTPRRSATRWCARPPARCAGSRWSQALTARGITHVIECGPGKVLAGMVKRIDADAGRRRAVYDPASLAEAKRRCCA